jgi:N-hydroxyarylamine O-acetyltransferase
LRPEHATPRQLAAYLERVGFVGRPSVDPATLTELHRRHVEAIPYENLDVQLGRRVTRDPRDAFEKIVTSGRGGWCYEMNGLFAWILETIGFRVTRLAGAVMREAAGDGMIGNHLVLLVDLDDRWIADVGLGNGLVEPIPLKAGPIRQRFMDYSLDDLGDGWWRFRNHAGNLPPSFDFSPDVTDEALLDERCAWLQADPASPFVQNALIQRQFPDRAEALVGAVHTRFTHAGPQSRSIASADEYEQVLADVFGLTGLDVRSLWPRIEARGSTGFA